MDFLIWIYSSALCIMLTSGGILILMAGAVYTRRQIRAKIRSVKINRRPRQNRRR